MTPLPLRCRHHIWKPFMVVVREIGHARTYRRSDGPRGRSSVGGNDGRRGTADDVGVAENVGVAQQRNSFWVYREIAAPPAAPADRGRDVVSHEWSPLLLANFQVPLLPSTPYKAFYWLTKNAAETYNVDLGFEIYIRVKFYFLLHCFSADFESVLRCTCGNDINE